MQSINGPRVEPASGRVADKLIVLCHGYGADGKDLIGLAPHWQKLLPNAAFVAPNAPERCDMSPAGYQWFPITRLDPDEISGGVRGAAPVLDRFIDAELGRLGLDESSLALVGFSQGTMMSLQVGLRRPAAPVAILGYSGALAGPDTLSSEMTVRTPIMLIHGTDDEMLPAASTLAAAQALGAAGLSVQWHLSPGVGHGIDPDGLEIGGQFLADAFAGRLQGSNI